MKTGYAFCTVRSWYGVRLAPVLAIALTALSGSARAQHPTDCEEHELRPVLSVGDFDGDGVVGAPDVRLIARHLRERAYVAFFDLNADGSLDGRDVAQTARAMGDSSSFLDRQLASLFWATERYRDMQVAIAAGYRPFTQILHGHGVHLATLPIWPGPGGLDPTHENRLDDHLEVAAPEGLNYDENGELIAVFFYHGIDVKDWVLANLVGDQAAVNALFNQSVHLSSVSAATGGMLPHLFDSPDALWHQHWGPCWDGLDYLQMAFDPTIVPQFSQPLFPQECAAQGQETGRRPGWIPAFNMLHVWLYKLNPCGIFAGTHPDVAVGFPEEPMVRPRSEWFQGMGIPDPYTGEGQH